MSEPYYRLHRPEQLITPCLLVYPQVVRANLEQSIAIAGGPARLRPHVKTHKTAEIVAMALDRGIAKHKCATLSEVRLLANCGVPDVLIAYPLVGPAIHKFVEIVQEFPQTRFSAVVDHLEPARLLSEQCSKHGVFLDVLVDIDCGMHRTGVPAGPAAAQLYEFLSQATSLRAAGLHVYDGHNHQPSLDERRAAVASLMQPVADLVRNLQSAGHAVPKLVCGGTPTFPVFANLPDLELDVDIELSPGTCFLSDHGYGTNYPDIAGLHPAALVMTRVVSKTAENLLTLDLGHKAIAADPPAGRRCHFPELPDAREVKQNEEHLVIETARAAEFAIGQELYAVPTHICPTVALHAAMFAVADNQLVESWQVAARDRIYH
ncbi:MAG: D-TA family PLP-dependent enzyme [Planctomycetales bacterium]|nr:D-TA family PLP-dependent enzyme [Planctomycetales bacterium]